MLLLGSRGTAPHKDRHGTAWASPGDACHWGMGSRKAIARVPWAGDPRGHLVWIERDVGLRRQ